MASQNKSGNKQSNQNNRSASTQRSQDGSQNASSRGTTGNEQVARSEEQLDREERSLIGNTSEDRNLTGSTTYVTLPDQQGDDSQDQSSRQSSRPASGSQQGSSGSRPPGGRSSSNHENHRGDSYGSSRGDTQR